MPDILNPYTYSLEQSQFLSKKFPHGSKDSTGWSDDDMKETRVALREYYRITQNGKCAYCKNQISLRSASNAQVEHIVPKSKYPEFVIVPKNLCVICSDCNEIKRNQEILNEIPTVTTRLKIKRYPTVSSAFRIIHPHFDNYEEHIFEINGFYLDKSKKGGYTILYCNLNRKLQKLGYETPLFSDIELMELMTQYLKEKDAIKKTYILGRLKKMLILI